jgi:hypothetical protein
VKSQQHLAHFPICNVLLANATTVLAAQIVFQAHFHAKPGRILAMIARLATLTVQQARQRAQMMSIAVLQEQRVLVPLRRAQIVFPALLPRLMLNRLARRALWVALAVLLRRQFALSALLVDLNRLLAKQTVLIARQARIRLLLALRLAESAPAAPLRVLCRRLPNVKAVPKAHSAVLLHRAAQTVALALLPQHPAHLSAIAALKVPSSPTPRQKHAAIAHLAVLNNLLDPLIVLIVIPDSSKPFLAKPCARNVPQALFHPALLPLANVATQDQPLAAVHPHALPAQQAHSPKATTQPCALHAQAARFLPQTALLNAHNAHLVFINQQQAIKHASHVNLAAFQVFLAQILAPFALRAVSLPWTA